jgi:hypothetical protein
MGSFGHLIVARRIRPILPNTKFYEAQSRVLFSTILSLPLSYTAIFPTTTVFNTWHVTLR